MNHHHDLTRWHVAIITAAICGLCAGLVAAWPALINTALETTNRKTIQMPTITITIDTDDQAIDIWAHCAHRYGLNRVDIHNGDHPEVVAEADPTPPHGTPRPALEPIVFANTTTTIKPKKPVVTSVACPYCEARAGEFCTSVTSGKAWAAYDYGHAARIRARDAAWKTQA